jgi:hypothetical protein
MKQSRRSVVSSFVGLAMALAAPVGVAASEGTQRSAAGGAVVGSWEIAATQEVPFSLTLPMLATFAPGGGLVGTDAIAFSGLADPDNPFSLLQSPGHGTWKASGRSVSFTYVKLNFDGRGQYNGSTRFAGSATLSSDLDSLTGTFSFEVLDPAGQTLFGGSGSIAGARIKVDE